MMKKKKKKHVTRSPRGLWASLKLASKYAWAPDHRNSLLYGRPGVTWVEARKGSLEREIKANPLKETWRFSFRASHRDDHQAILWYRLTRIRIC